MKPAAKKIADIEKTARKRRIGRDLGGASEEEEEDEVGFGFKVWDATLAAVVESEDADAGDC